MQGEDSKLGALSVYTLPVGYVGRKRMRRAGGRQSTRRRHLLRGTYVSRQSVYASSEGKTRSDRVEFGGEVAKSFQLERKEKCTPFPRNDAAFARNWKM